MDNDDDEPLAAVVVPIATEERSEEYYVHLTEAVKRLGYMLCFHTCMLIPMFGYLMYKMMSTDATRPGSICSI